MLDLLARLGLAEFVQSYGWRLTPKGKARAHKFLASNPDPEDLP